jgi:predicted AlkP superfamily pyrophosphatase or phosphodiesterase
MMLTASGCAARQAASRVVIISVDGLSPGDLRRAESLGVALPVLDSLVRAGVLAEGVVGSVPSVTYPSHTTIITGVPPARHGIYSNRRSWLPTDTGAAAQAWYWEAGLIRVPTIFDAAHAAGRRTAAVGWPATTEDERIDYNIPEVWHPLVFGDSDLAVIRHRGTPGLLDSLRAPVTGPLTDSLRALWSADIVRRWDPDLIALHLIDVDHWKHERSPTGDSVWTALARADRQIGWVLDALRERSRPTTVIVTSDHGFLAYRSSLRPGVLLRRAGLVTLDSAGRVRDWSAAVVVNGGNAMFVPRDPLDPAIGDRIRSAISDSLVGPGRPIRAVWSRDSLAALGGDPRALWAIDMNDGFYTRPGYGGELVTKTERGGGHGYDPRRPELHAFLVAAGPDIRAGSRLGIIQQTAIASTIVRWLRLRTAGFEGTPLF